MVQYVNKGNMCYCWVNVCVSQCEDLCIFFHFLYEWIGPEKTVWFPTLHCSIVSNTLFYSLLVTSPHSATLLVTGQDRNCQVLMARTHTHMHTHICTHTLITLMFSNSARGEQGWQTRAAGWRVFPVLTASVWAQNALHTHRRMPTHTVTCTHIHTYTHTQTMQLSHNGNTFFSLLLTRKFCFVGIVWNMLILFQAKS